MLRSSSSCCCFCSWFSRTSWHNQLNFNSKVKLCQPRMICYIVVLIFSDWFLYWFSLISNYLYDTFVRIAKTTIWRSIERTMYYESYITTTIYIMSWQYSPIWIIRSLCTLYIKLKVDHMSKRLRLINDQKIMVMKNNQSVCYALQILSSCSSDLTSLVSFNHAPKKLLCIYTVYTYLNQGQYDYMLGTIYRIYANRYMRNALSKI